MRRKSILAIVLGMSLLLSTPVMADVPDINLASMSFIANTYNVISI